LRAVYDGLIQTRPDAAPYVAAILTASARDQATG